MQFRTEKEGMVVKLAAADKRQFSKLYETMATIARVFPTNPNYTAFVVTLNGIHREIDGDDISGWDEGWQSRFELLMQKVRPGPPPTPVMPE